MSKNIDYEAYLKTIGDFEINQQNQIKKYLEEQCKTDEALKAVYNEAEIKNCYEFIKECVRRKNKGSGVCVEDAVVYKMVRDYFIEILPDIEKEPVDISNENAAEKVAEQMDEDVKTDANVNDDLAGFEVFGEDEEEPEEEVTEVAETPEEQEPVHQNIEKENLLNGCKYKTGSIIDSIGIKLGLKDLFRGLHFIHADKPSSILDMVVCEVIDVNEEHVSYKANDKQHFQEWKRNGESDIDGLIYGNFYSIPENAKVVGELVDHIRKHFEEAEEVSNQFDDEGNALLFGF